VRCPYCGAMDTKVIETRTAEEGRAIRRRRECPDCGQRFTTYERLEESKLLLVIKKGGHREAFDREKLLRGLVKACEKLPVPLERLEDAASQIEKRLRDMGQGEVSSSLIGELAMEALKEIHQVAYVRFASVYREFCDINQFYQEIHRLVEERGKAE